jgi:hypothetical protein
MAASKAAKSSSKKTAPKSAAKGASSAKKTGAAKSRTNHGNPWSTADMKQLRQLARERTLIRVAAEQLGRSLDSVKSKASEEGISFKGPKRAAAKRSK